MTTQVFKALIAQWREYGPDDVREAEAKQLWVTAATIKARLACADDLDAAVSARHVLQSDDRIVALERAIGNCFMMSKREIARLWKHHGDESELALTLERWQHVQRFCETTGSKSSILRSQLPTEITEGSSRPVLQGWQPMADAAEMLWVALANMSGGVAHICGPGNGNKAAEDFDFIAHARSDIPYLLVALARLQAEHQRLLVIEADYIKGEDSEDGPRVMPQSRTVQVYARQIIPVKATPRVDSELEKEWLESGEYKALQRVEQLEAEILRLQAERDELRALAGKLAPEVEAIIQRVVALPPLSEKPADIKKWAERLAADVGDLTD